MKRARERCLAFGEDAVESAEMLRDAVECLHDVLLARDVALPRLGRHS